MFKKWNDGSIKEFLIPSEYKLIDSFRMPQGKTNLLYVNLTCPNGSIFTTWWNDFRRGKSKCNCNICYNQKYGVVKFTDYEARLEFLKYKLILIDEFTGIGNKVYCINKEGYVVKVSLFELYRFKDAEVHNWKPFLKENKYQFYNLKLFCELERPDYQVVRYNSNLRATAELVVKYVGRTNKKSLTRYFKTTIRGFTVIREHHRGLKIKSKGEFKIDSLLKKFNIVFQREFRLQDCRNKIPLPFDFAIFSDSGQLLYLIEYDGEQHYNESHYFKTFSLEQRISNDSIRNEYCKLNNIPLHRISYKDYKNIDKIVEGIINEEKKNKRAEIRRATSIS